MTNFIVLEGWMYVALLSTIGLVGLALVLQGLWISKIVKYTQMNGMDIWNATQTSKYQLAKSVDKALIKLAGEMQDFYSRNHQATTTRLVYIKGQLDRVLNGQVAIKKETQEIKTRQAFSKKRELKVVKATKIKAK